MSSNTPIDLRGSQGAVIGATGPISQTFVGLSAEQVSTLILQLRRTDQPRTWDGRRPYVGLASFKQADAGFFFGRKQVVDELLARLQRARLVCMAGPSGSGKSSVVQAGLIPALREGRLDGSSHWLVERMTPQGSPLEQLGRAVSAMALAAGKPSTVGDELRGQAPASPLALHRLVDLLVNSAGAGRAILYVDQFEELFTQTRSEEERRLFLDQLIAAATYAQGPVTVLLSLRSDFLSQCATYPALRTLISQEFQLLGAMDPPELAEAITRPALEVGAEIEPELVAHLIADMKGEPGALPLMAFALKDLFDAQAPQQGKPLKLSLDSYLARGGIEQALERHADAVFDQMGEGARQIARNIFTHLIEVGRGTADTRRTASLSELVGPQAGAGEVKAIVAVLADARLVTTASPGLEGEATITVAHETLIDAWPWLRRLVNENREAIELQNQIAEDAAEWQRNQRDASYLYAGARLATVREKLAAQQLALSGPAQEFVDAALAEREARRQAEDQQRRRELEQAQQLAEEQRRRADAEEKRAADRTRSARRIGLIAAGLVVVAVAAVAAALFAYQQTRTAEARQLAAQSGGLSASQVDTSLLLAVEAYNRQPRNLADVSSSLLAASQCCSDSLLALMRGHTDRVWDVAFGPGSDRLASSSDDGTIVIWDVAARRPITTIVNPDSAASVFTVAFSPDGNLLASGDGDGVILLRDTHTWQPTGLPLRNHDFNVHSLKFNRDGSLLVSGGGDGNVVVWNVAGHTPVRTFTGHTHWVWDVAISRDDQTVASVGRDNTVRLWSLDSSPGLTTTLVITGPHRGVITSVAFNDDPKQPLMVSGDANGRVVVWDMRPWEQARSTPIPTALQPVHAGIVWSLEFVPHDPTSFVSSGGNGVIRRQRIEIAGDFADSKLVREKLGVTGHAGGIFRMALSPDARFMAGAGLDNLVSLWQLDEAPNVLWHTAAVSSLAALTGTQLASVDRDGKVSLWDLGAADIAGQRHPAIEVILAPTLPFSTSAISLDGARVATGGAARQVIVWDAKAGTVSARLDGHRAVVTALAFSPDGHWLASADQNGAGILWDLETSALAAHFDGQRGAVNSLAFSPDGTILALGSCGSPITFPVLDCGRGAIYLWDMATKIRIGAPLPGKSGAVLSLAFNPAVPAEMAAGTRDGSVTVWDLPTRTVRLNLVLENSADINTLAFSPDGKLLAVGIDDFRFYLYDAHTGQLFGRFFKEHDASVTGLAFSRDGSSLYSASLDRTIVVHDLRPQHWLERSCRFANRDLTPEEWQRYLGDSAYRKTCSA